MALRVLLADESTTIKKVMQLALQDFAVEVKAVPIGLDVLPVTKNFKPDIIFVDVLLTKKSGYDVCLELKSDAATAHIPIVLMWSSFMELDEQKFTSSKANGRLEKPFDADSLRQLVETLAPKTQTQPTSSYLQFPPLPEFDEKVATPTNPLDSIPSIEATPELNIPVVEEVINIDEIPMIESVDDLPDYSAATAIEPIELHPEPSSHSATSTAKDNLSGAMMVADSADEDEGWTRQDLTKFKIQLPEVESDDFASKFVIPQDDLSQVQIADSEDFQEITFAEPRRSQNPKPSAQPQPVKENTISAQTPIPTQSSKASDKDMDNDRVERIIREEARAAIEAIAWRILPEITERVVREELHKLLRDTENSL